MSHKSANTRALLERARLLCEPPTWYQLAKRTGIKQQTISRCIAQEKTLGDVNAYKLAKLLEMEVKDVMAYMAEDRAQDADTKTFWTHQLPRLVPSIAIAVATTLASVTGGSLIDGSRDWAKVQLTLPAIHYAQLKKLLRLRLRWPFVPLVRLNTAAL